MFYTYIIANKRNGTLYTGHTDNLGERMRQHRQRIYPGFAAEHNCKRLIWFETHDTRHEAFTRERRIKAWERAWKLEMAEKENPDWLDISMLPTWPLPKDHCLDVTHAIIKR